MSLIAISSNAIVRGPARCLNGMITKLGEGSERAAGGEVRWEAGHHWHVGEIEATRSAGGYVVVVHREVSVAVSIRSGRSNVRWIEDVGIDQGELEQH